MLRDAHRGSVLQEDVERQEARRRYLARLQQKEKENERKLQWNVTPRWRGIGRRASRALLLASLAVLVSWRAADLTAPAVSQAVSVLVDVMHGLHQLPALLRMM